MSQVTRCPACGTSFRVVPDQLRISQGWVRCGQCNEIFDAARDLRDQAAGRTHGTADAAVHEAPAPAPAAVTEAPAREAQERDVADAGPHAPTLVDVAPQWLQNAPPEIPVTDPAASLDVGFAEYQQAQAQAEEPPPGESSTEQSAVRPPDVDDALPLQLGPDRLFIAIAPDAAARPEGAAGVDAMPLPQRPAAQWPMSPTLPARPAGHAAPVPVASAREPVRAEVSFLREAAEAEAVRSTALQPRRARWVGAAVVLLFVLLAQWALHARDRIAVAAPALRPLLQALCAPLGCSVQPLRRIDAIVIDGSAFIASGEAGYRLSLTLRNRASHAVALPALVLSLTDIQEQPVVRRVLLPGELGTPPSELGPHGEWSTSVDLQMADFAGRARVVGYRLDTFYP